MNQNYEIAGLLIITALGAAMLFWSSDPVFAFAGLLIGLYGIIRVAMLRNRIKTRGKH